MGKTKICSMLKFVVKVKKSLGCPKLQICIEESLGRPKLDYKFHPLPESGNLMKTHYCEPATNLSLKKCEFGLKTHLSAPVKHAKFAQKPGETIQICIHYRNSDRLAVARLRYGEKTKQARSIAIIKKPIRLSV